MIMIEGLQHILRSLETLDLSPVQQSALAAEAEQMAGAVREALSHSPGTDHETPWFRTGELRDSIVSEATGDEAVVASSAPVAVFQEHGTATVPPRPFLAPVAAAGAARAADVVAEAVVTHIREVLR